MSELSRWHESEGYGVRIDENQRSVFGLNVLLFKDQFLSAVGAEAGAGRGRQMTEGAL